MVGCGQPGIEANLYQTRWYVCPVRLLLIVGGQKTTIAVDGDVRQ